MSFGAAATSANLIMTSFALFTLLLVCIYSIYRARLKEFYLNQLI